MGGVGGERLFEFDWEEEGVDAYSRWALIRGWALIRINTGICIYRNYGVGSRDIPVFKLSKCFYLLTSALSKLSINWVLFLLLRNLVWI